MKEKIASALKTKYANLGLSQKAFDGVAAFLEKTITNESDIESAIAGDDVSALLKAFQGESDSLRTARQKAEKELEEYKTRHPETKTTEPDQQDEVSRKLAELEAKQAAYDKRIAEAESKAKKQTILTNLDRLLKEKGCDNDFIRGITLKGVDIKDEDTAESLLDAYKGEYDKNYKDAYGDGAIPPAGSRTPAAYEKGGFSDEVARLKAEGKLPNESK